MHYIHSPAPSLCWESGKSQSYSFVTLERRHYLWVSDGTPNPRTLLYAHVHIQSSAQDTVRDTLLGHFYSMSVGLRRRTLSAYHNTKVLTTIDRVSAFH